MPSAKEKETRNTLACKGSFKTYIQIICAKHAFITGLFSSSLGASYFAVSNEQGFDLNQSARPVHFGFNKLHPWEKRDNYHERVNRNAHPINSRAINARQKDFSTDALPSIILSCYDS
jgi:hypothetical protein